MDVRSENSCFCQVPENFQRLKESFESTTNFGKLQKIETVVAGRQCHLRFVCSTGDAMGMNMVSKGCLQVFDDLSVGDLFPDLELLSLSGNYCTDKKPSAVNWIEGRGKSVVCEVSGTPNPCIACMLVSQIVLFSFP